MTPAERACLEIVIRATGDLVQIQQDNPDDKAAVARLLETIMKVVATATKALDPAASDQIDARLTAGLSMLDQAAAAERANDVDAMLKLKRQINELTERARRGEI